VDGNRIAVTLLRTVLPDVMFSAQELAIETIRQAGTGRHQMLSSGSDTLRSWRSGWSTTTSRW
jgi:hypothetical protein